MEDKQFYIHIGIHKTGTTSVQRMFFLNRPYFENLGLLYPTKSIWRGGHHNIAWQILKDERFKDNYGDIDNLKNEIEKKYVSKCLLSSEDFSRFGFKDVEKLYQLFKKYKPKVIISIRNQFDYIVSSWSTVVRNESTDASFNQYYKFCMRKRLNLLKYDIFLKSWEEVFGQENILINIYNKGLGLNLYKNFLKILLLRNDIEELNITERVNESLPLQELNVIRILNKNKLGLENKKRTPFIEDLIFEINQNYVVRKSIVEPKNRLRLRKETDDFFEESNHKVALEYFNRERLFLE